MYKPNFLYILHFTWTGLQYNFKIRHTISKIISHSQLCILLGILISWIKGCNVGKDILIFSSSLLIGKGQCRPICFAAKKAPNHLCRTTCQLKHRDMHSFLLWKILQYFFCISVNKLATTKLKKSLKNVLTF